MSQHKIQMIGYFANLVGLGFNLVGTFLLLKYSPESKTTEEWPVTGNFEKELIPVFEGFIKKAHDSIILLSIGFALQFLWRRSCCNSPKRLPMTYLARQLKAANDQ